MTAPRGKRTAVSKDPEAARFDPIRAGEAGVGASRAEAGAAEDDRAPWYAKGLRFSCRQCGRCCRGPGGFVWLTEAEAERIAGTLDMTPDRFGTRFLRRVCGALALVDGAEGDCPFLDPKRGCRIYAVRPVQCRTFPWWPEVVEDEEAWADAGRQCPGIGHGTRHALPVIEKGLEPHTWEV